MSFCDVGDLREKLLTDEPSEFVSKYLLEPVPYAFNQDQELWIEWKTCLAKLLGVDPFEIVLAGSGAVGFSLNPGKNFSKYNDKSDIDVCVISQYHFEVAWRYLRSTRSSWLSLPSRTRRALENHRKNYVFSGAIATDMILSLLPFGKQWQGALDEMSERSPTVGREVKLRVYKDYDALRVYQAHGIKRLREEVLDLEDMEGSIPLEE